MSVRSTVKAIILHNNKILLNKCYDQYNGDYYSLPGGGQDQYETIYDAVTRECLEETGYHIRPIKFCGICEEICDNEDTRKNYSVYAHKLYHLFVCELVSEIQDEPTNIDDMQEQCEWINIEAICNIRLLPTMLNNNIHTLLTSNTAIDLGSIHIPYNHG